MKMQNNEVRPCDSLLGACEKDIGVQRAACEFAASVNLTLHADERKWWISKLPAFSDHSTDQSVAGVTHVCNKFCRYHGL